MPAPAPTNGRLVTTVAPPYATTSLQGSTVAADYIDYSNPNSYSFFGDFLLRENNIVFTVVDPFANKTGTYTIPLLTESNAIEYISRDNGSSGPFATGVYKIVAPGDYRSNTIETGVQVYGTNANDIVYGLIGSEQSNALYGGAGDDTLVSGNTKFAVFTGGSGTNTYVSGSGENRYKIELVDKGTHIINASGGNDIVQVLLSSSNFDWNFKRVGNDLVGTIWSTGGNVSKITVQNQYTTGQIESFLFFVNGNNTNGSSFAGFGLNDPGVGTYTGTSKRMLQVPMLQHLIFRTAHGQQSELLVTKEMTSCMLRQSLQEHFFMEATVLIQSLQVAWLLITQLRLAHPLMLQVEDQSMLRLSRMLKKLMQIITMVLNASNSPTKILPLIPA